jgi:shikimate kinase
MAYPSMTKFTEHPRQRFLLSALGNRSIVLVGMMGSGKSTVGRKLGQRLQLPFADSDDEVRNQSGMSIDDFFEKYGEKEFRRGESRVISALLFRGPQIIATGGGAFCNAETQAAIRAEGLSIWLKGDPKALVARVLHKPGRPLLAGDEPTAEYLRISAEREPTYANADITIELKNRQRDKIVQEIMNKTDTLISILEARPR